MIKNIFYTAIIALCFVACNSEKQGSMVVEGTIHGFKKGTLYLQKVQDTAIISIDSIFLNGNNVFRLVDNVESPELYYLTLNQLEQERIDFFGEKGTININTKLEKFGTSATVTGSKSNDILLEYRDMKDKFMGKRLDIIKATFEAQTAKDNEQIAKLDKDLQNLIKNRYRYTASFAMRNNNSEVAPYLALTELYDAHIALLDTVNNTLTKTIQNSKYGLALDKYIKEVKLSEEN